MSLHKEIDERLAGDRELDSSCKTQIQKLANAAEKAFADRAILLDENLLLFEQNNERNTRKSIKATAVGKAKILSYKDIVEAQRQHDMKDARADVVCSRGRPKRKSSFQVLGKRSCSQELVAAEQEIKSLRMEEYCSVLQF